MYFVVNKEQATQNWLISVEYIREDLCLAVDCQDFDMMLIKEPLYLCHVITLTLGWHRDAMYLPRKLLFGMCMFHLFCSIMCIQ